MQREINNELYTMTEEIEKRIDIGNQLTQIAEEATELAQAALKYRRALQTEYGDKGISPTPKTANETYVDLVEECSDVMLSLMVFGEGLISDGIMLNKARRWLDRLKRYRDEGEEND